MPRRKKTVEVPSNPLDSLTPSDLMEGVFQFITADRFTGEQLALLCIKSHDAWRKEPKAARGSPEEVAAVEVNLLSDSLKSSKLKRVLPTLDWGAQPQKALRYLMLTLDAIDEEAPRIHVMPQVRKDWLEEVDTYNESHRKEKRPGPDPTTRRRRTKTGRTPAAATAGRTHTGRRKKVATEEAPAAAAATTQQRSRRSKGTGVRKSTGTRNTRTV